MGEKNCPLPVEEPFSECDEPQSERSSDSNKDYISCEEMSQEFHRNDEKNNSDPANPVRQQKRKIPLEEAEETDHFEDTENTPSFSSDDNKVHLKRAVNLEKKTFADPKKMKLDFDRINELDKFKNIPPARSFFNHSLVPQAEDFKKCVFNYFQDPLPGPSDLMPKRKKRAKKTTETAEDDCSAEDDVKAIADCIVENTLNVLDITGVTVYTDDLIELNVIAPGSPHQECENNPGPVVIPMAEENAAIGSNDNLEKRQLPSTDPETANANYRSMEIVENSMTDRKISEIPDTSEGISQAEEQEEEDTESTALSVARASREALFDPDSVPDLLEDFEIPPPIQEADNIAIDAMDFANGAILIGILPLGNAADLQDVANNGFPHWLLQILGTQVGVEEVVNPAENADEPHYYCQGDGLGVHPSVLAVEVDGDDGDVEESTESSSDNTAAEVDQGLSSQDMSSLPEDPQTITEAQELLPEESDMDEGAHLAGTSEQVEFYDTLSSTSDTGIQPSRSI